MIRLLGIVGLVWLSWTRRSRLKDLPLATFRNLFRWPARTSGHAVELPVTAYPALRSYYGAYLNQDYDLFGETPDEIARHYRDVNGPFAARRLAGDMRHFLTEHQTHSDQEFREAFRNEFHPEASFEDWKHQTLREFLLDQISILQPPPAPEPPRE